MDPEPITTLTVLLLRLVGSLGGAMIAIVILVPNTVRGALQRFSVSIASGLMLTPLVRHYLEWPDNYDNIVMGACVVSGLSWWAWHAVIRLAQRTDVFTRK